MPKQEQSPSTESIYSPDRHHTREEVHKGDHIGTLTRRETTRIPKYVIQDGVRVLEDYIDARDFMEYDICDVDPGSTSIVLIVPKGVF